MFFRAEDVVATFIDAELFGVVKFDDAFFDAAIFGARDFGVVVVIDMVFGGVEIVDVIFATVEFIDVFFFDAFFGVAVFLAD